MKINRAISLGKTKEWLHQLGHEVCSQDVVEIIAPVNVKEMLSVKNGDELTLEVQGRRG